MKNPDLAEIMNQTNAAKLDGEEALVDFRTEGETANRKKYDAAKAEHAAYVMVAYARDLKTTLAGTNLVVMPGRPSNLTDEALGLPEGFTWPTGMILGNLGTDGERKAAVKAMVAHLIKAYDDAYLASRYAAKATALHQGVVTMGQSFIKAEMEEYKIDSGFGVPSSEPRKRSSWTPPPHDDSDF